jgi:hypothetical protein
MMLEIVQLPTRYSLDTSIFINVFILIFIYLFSYFIFLYFQFYSFILPFSEYSRTSVQVPNVRIFPSQKSFYLIWYVHVIISPCICIINSCVFPLVILPIDGDPLNIYWYILWICPSCKEHDLCQAWFQENRCVTINMTNHCFTFNTFTYPCVVVKLYN